MREKEREKEKEIEREREKEEEDERERGGKKMDDQTKTERRETRKRERI